MPEESSCPYIPVCAFWSFRSDHRTRSFWQRNHITLWKTESSPGIRVSCKLQRIKENDPAAGQGKASSRCADMMSAMLHNRYFPDLLPGLSSINKRNEQKWYWEPVLASFFEALPLVWTGADKGVVTRCAATSRNRDDRHAPPMIAVGPRQACNSRRPFPWHAHTHIGVQVQLCKAMEGHAWSGQIR